MHLFWLLFRRRRAGRCIAGRRVVVAAAPAAMAAAMAVGAFFAVSDAVKEITPWSNKTIVSSRGYMLGYNDLKSPSVSGFFRFLAKLGDGFMKMQIVRIDFREVQ